MLDAFSARLEARDPTKGHFRSYRLEAGTDLLGNWLVDITYGRIGTRGRRVRHVASNAAEAKKLVKHALRRRSTAKKRIGTGYRFLELHDPNAWFSLELG
jgi:predicted DNA-binding WGR domain protein